MTPSAAYLILIDALMLARERVTADTLAEKQSKRDAIKAAVNGLHQWEDGDPGAKPTAAQLRELLGDPDDREIRRALEAWDDPAPHSD